MKKFNKVRYEVYGKWILILLLNVLIAACGKAPEDEKVESGDEFAAGVIIVNNLVSRAEWDSDRERLTISGDARRGDSQVKVFDGVYPNVLIGTAFVDGNREWRLRKNFNSNAEVPCSVRVETDSVAQKVSVRRAPPDCSAAYANNVNNNPANAAPDSMIISPTSTLSVFVGDSVNFRGSAIDPDGDTNLTYFWNFSGGALNSTALNPGNIQFNTAGTFQVQFTATDSTGLSDPTPAAVTVIVNGISSGNNPPNGIIEAPVTNSSYLLGTTLNLVASATDVDGDSNLRYIWDFGGYAPRQAGKSVSLSLNEVGVVNVKLFVRDSTQLWDPTPATIYFTVADQIVDSNRAPNGIINSPVGNQTINVGQSINFSASGSDPDGDAISYQWDFSNSGIPQSHLRVPGSTQFNTAGTYVVSLLVTDISGLSDPSPATVIITVNDNNAAPNATIISPSQNRTINVGDSINFAGSAVDPDNDAMSYRWNFAGSGVPQNTQQNPGNITFNQAGTFLVSFTAIDAKGLEDATPDTVTITVKGNTAPDGTIVSPNANQVINAGDSLLFAGSGFDAEGDSLTFNWNFDGVVPNSTQQNPGSVQFASPGVYHIRLTVTDARGLSDASPAEVQVTVQSITSNNQEPQSVINSPANSISIQRGQTVSFSGSGSDPDNDTPLTYHWDFAGGAANSNKQNPGNVRFDQAGFFPVSLTVTDSKGLADSTPAIRYVQVVGSTGNQAPISTITNPPADMTVHVGDSVLFTATATDPENNTPLSYFWNFDGAAPNSLAQNPGQVRFDVVGTYFVKLSATDSLGATDASPAVRVITVTNSHTTVLPDSQILQPANDLIISVGDSVNFQGRGLDPDGNTPFAHLWNFAGVAPNSTLASPGNIRFDNAGIYQISYRVTNSLGISDPTPASVQVIVQNIDAVNEPPNSTILTPSMNMTIYEGDSLSFSGVGFDPDGDALNYLWSFDGAAPDKYVQNPGVVRFNTPGVFTVLMTASDSTGLTDPTPATLTVTVNPVTANNSAPNALASPNTDVIIYEGDSVNFTGLGLDPDGDAIVKYFWNFDGAVPNSSEQSPGSVTFAQAGTYRVRFNVTDSRGLSDPTPDEILVTVQQYNMPTGNLAPNGIINSPANDMVITVGNSINFTASAIDPDNDQPISYRWNFDGAVPNTTAQNPGWVTFNRVGTYRVVLTVTDSSGKSDASPAERFITVQGVQSANQPPNGSIALPATEQVINTGDSVYFAGGGTDPESNFPLMYYWDFGGAMPNSIGATPGSITFMQAGTYDVKLRVIDSLGLMDPTPATVRIRVGNAPTSNQPPEGVINSPLGNPTISVGDSLLFSGEGIDPEGGSVSYHWDFGASGISQKSAQTTVATFNLPGTFSVNFTVTDEQGLADPTPASMTVTVDGNTPLSNEPDGTIISPANGPIHISKGDSLQFEAHVSDPNGDTDLFVLWNFGSYPITNKVGESVRVTFDQVGVAVVTLKVRDSTNLWDPTPATITVHVQ